MKGKIRERIVLGKGRDIEIASGRILAALDEALRQRKIEYVMHRFKPEVREGILVEGAIEPHLLGYQGSELLYVVTYQPRFSQGEFPSDMLITLGETVRPVAGNRPLVSGFMGSHLSYLEGAARTHIDRSELPQHIDKILDAVDLRAPD